MVSELFRAFQSFSEVFRGFQRFSEISEVFRGFQRFFKGPLRDPLRVPFSLRVAGRVALIVLPLKTPASSAGMATLRKFPRRASRRVVPLEC